MKKKDTPLRFLEMVKGSQFSLSFKKWEMEVLWEND